MTRVLHVVSSIGDPTHPRTWSGTPRAILTALEALGVRVVVHDISPRGRVRRLGRLLNRLIYGTSGEDRAGLVPWLGVRKAQQIASREGKADFLHFGSGHLPIQKRKPNQRHYLFTDYAVFLLSANPEFRARTNRRLRAAAEAGEAKMVDQLDGIFTTADYVAAAFTTKYNLPPGKSVAVKSGLGRIIEDVTDKSYDGYMIFVARQNFINKGGRLLLNAFDIVRSHRPDATLVIIGNAADPTQMEDLERMRNTPGISFHNYDTPDFQALIAGATLYAGPALDEPWGIIYLESLCSRTPIAGMRRNAFPQFAGEGKFGFISEEASVTSVAEMLLNALSDPARLALMGELGRKHVLREYSWERVAERIVEHLALTAIPA